MSKIRIATDSTADIPKSFCEELNISVLPLTILSGEKEYRDGVDISPAEFYRIIDESEKLPVSSQVASVLYSDLFEETWKAGYHRGEAFCNFVNRPSIVHYLSADCRSQIFDFHGVKPS